MSSNPKLSGVSTEVWGPKAWGFLHSIAFSFPKEPTVLQREAVYKMLLSLSELLPCNRCREHYNAYLKNPSHGLQSSSSEHLSSGDNLSRWLVELHNDVNDRLDKPRLEYDDVAALYSGDYTCPPEHSRSRPHGSLLADLCDRVASPDETLEKGLPGSLVGCFVRFPGGNTGIAVSIVVIIFILIAIRVVIASQSKRNFLRHFERQLLSSIP